MIEFFIGAIIGLILGTIATALCFVYLITRKSGVLLLTLAGIKAKHAEKEEEKKENSS